MIFLQGFTMKSLITLLCLSLLSITHRCQPPAKYKKMFAPQPIEIDWLKNIRTTTRISSNHYSDFVMNLEGNSYIASFFTEESVDYLYLAKVSPNGEILWEIDGPNEGRATAIAIDDRRELIWVTGFFRKGIEIGGESAFAPFGELFLAQLDAEGNCLQLITGEGGAVGYDLCVNTTGQILLAGTRGSEMTIGDCNLESKGVGSFIAIFNIVQPITGECFSLQNLSGYVNRVHSDSKGNFYACGQFNGAFEIGELHGQTESSFDQDGFLLKLDFEGKPQWFRQYGKSGNERYGYRSREGFSDLVVSPKGLIQVVGASNLDYPDFDGTAQLLLENESSLKTVVVTYSPEGVILNQKIIATGTSEGSIHTLTQSAKNNFYLTFSCEKNATIVGLPPLEFEDKFKSVLLKFNPGWQLVDHHLPADGTDALFRNGFAQGGAVHFTGHYRGQLEIGKNKVKNTGNHGLFLLRAVERLWTVD